MQLVQAHLFHPVHLFHLPHKVGEVEAIEGGGRGSGSKVEAGEKEIGTNTKKTLKSKYMYPIVLQHTQKYPKKLTSTHLATVTATACTVGNNGQQQQVDSDPRSILLLWINC